MVDAIIKEINDRHGYINGQIDTIYFGGGTPSLLESDQLSSILNELESNFLISKSSEITLEANPEDLSLEKAESLKKIGINRLSIGVQTFNDEKLHWMNRIHDSSDAVIAFENSRKAGFSNISLDLIYAVPNAEATLLISDLKKITELSAEHISLYGLTIEPRTVFGKWKDNGKLQEMPEDKAADQYIESINYLNDHGYQQYEVSNFSKEGFQSKHNSSYWAGIPYLGVGPGAHSYDGRSRRFNVSNNTNYIKGIDDKKCYFEVETLTNTQMLNERILIGLRRVKGIALDELSKTFQVDLLQAHKEVIDHLLSQGFIKIEERNLRLSPQGFLVADEIALQLFSHE